MELTATEAWARVLERARPHLSEQTFRSWLEHTEPLALSRDRLTVSASSDFAAEWIEDKYGDLLSDVAARVFGRPIAIAFEHPSGQEGTRNSAPVPPPAVTEPVRPEPPRVETQNAAAPGGPVPGAPAIATGTVSGNVAFGSQLNERYTFDRFVVGANNQLSAAACRAVAEAPARMYNPLFIYGGVGLGKTHLMHAIGHAILAKDASRRVAYISSERFTNDLIASIQEGRMADFRRRYREIDLLLIDDVHFLGEKERTQEEFFHTFNALFEGQQQIILTCDRYPKEVDGLEERLKSRFGWGLTVAIEPPELETCVAILMSKAAVGHVDLPEEVAFFIAKRIRSNVRELEGALRRVVANSQFTGRAITMDFAKEALRDLLALQDRLVTIENIQKTVAEYYKIRVADLLSKRRNRSIARPRQVAMALAKELTSHSLPEIGDAFGGRDHTTVLHACRVIKELRDSSTRTSEDYSNLLRTLAG